MNIATFSISQNALYGNPDQFAPFLKSAVSSFLQKPLPFTSEGDYWTCEPEGYIDGPHSSKNLIILPNSIQVEFANSSSFVVSSSLDIAIQTKGFYVDKKDYVFWCSPKVKCPVNEVSLKNHISLTIPFTITWNPTTNSASITHQIFALFGNWEIQACKYNKFQKLLVKFLSEVEFSISNTFEQFSDIYAQSIASLLSEPQRNLLFQGNSSSGQSYNVLWDYKVVQMAITPKEFAVIKVNGSLMVEFLPKVAGDPSTFIVFDDPDEAGASTYPPPTWTSTLDPGSLPNQRGRLILNSGIRFSSTMFKAILWAADVSGEFNHHHNASILDAALTTRIRFGNPLYSMTPQNVLSIGMDNGLINITCLNSIHQYTEAVIVFSFSNITGTGGMSYSNIDKPIISLTVDKLNLEWSTMDLSVPPFPIPNSVKIDVMRQLMNKSTPLINEWLKGFPLVIPLDARPFLLQPTLQVKHQPGCCNEKHGYVELMSYCACDKQDTGIWMACPPIKACTSARTKNNINTRLLDHSISRTQKLAIVQQKAILNPEIKWKHLDAIFNHTRSHQSVLQTEPILFLFGINFGNGSKCSLDLHTEQLGVDSLEWTNICKGLPSAPIINGTFTKYYKLQKNEISSDSNEAFGLLSYACDDSDCTDCRIGPDLKVKLGSCVIIENSRASLVLQDGLRTSEGNPAAPDGSDMCFPIHTVAGRAANIINEYSLPPNLPGLIQEESLTSVLPSKKSGQSPRINHHIQSQERLRNSQTRRLKSSRETLVLNDRKVIELVNELSTAAIDPNPALLAEFSVTTSIVSCTWANIISIRHIGTSNACSDDDAGQHSPMMWVQHSSSYTPEKPLFDLFWDCGKACNTSSCSHSLQGLNQLSTPTKCSPHPQYKERAIALLYPPAISMCPHVQKKEQKESSTGAKVAIILGVVSLISILVSCIWYKRKMSQPDSHAPSEERRHVRVWMNEAQSSLSAFWQSTSQSAYYLGVRLCDTTLRLLRSCGVWIENHIDKPTIPQHPLVRERFLVMALVSCAQFIQLISWHLRSPFRVFTSEAFDGLGFSMHLFDTSDTEAIFNGWTVAGQKFALLCFIAVVITGLIPLVLKNQKSALRMDSFRIGLLCFILVGQFMLFAIPSMILDTKKSIKILPSDTNFIQRNDEMRQSMSDAISYAFTGIVLSYLSNIFLFIFHGIPISLYFVVINLLHRDVEKRDEEFNQRLIQAKSSNELENAEAIHESKSKSSISNVDNADSWYVERQETLFTRISVILWLSQLVVMISSLIPVIIMYQTFELNWVWLVCWTLLWFAPLICIFHLHWAFSHHFVQQSSGSIALHVSRHHPNYSLQLLTHEQQKELYSNRLTATEKLNKELYENKWIYLFVYLPCTVYLLGIEAVKTESSVLFPTTLVFNNSVLVGCIAYLILNKVKDYGECVTQKMAVEAKISQYQSQLTMGESQAVSARKIDDYVDTELSQGTKNAANLEPPRLSTKIYNLAIRLGRPILEWRDGTRRRISVSEERIDLKEPLLFNESDELSFVNTSEATSAMSSSGDAPQYDIEDTDALALARMLESREREANTLGCLNRLFFEALEITNPTKFGLRLRYRRALLMLGTCLFTILVVTDLNRLAALPPADQRLTKLLQSMGMSFYWPNGTQTIFDDAFQAYDHATTMAVWFKVAVLVCFYLSLFTDICLRSKTGLEWSRMWLYFSVLMLLLSVLSTAMPNYLESTNLEEVCPYCAPRFNRVLLTIGGYVVGMLCSLLLSAGCAAILLAICPSLVRAAVLMVLTERARRIVLKNRLEKEEKKREKRKNKKKKQKQKHENPYMLVSDQEKLSEPSINDAKLEIKQSNGVFLDQQDTLIEEKMEDEYNQITVELGEAAIIESTQYSVDTLYMLFGLSSLLAPVITNQMMIVFQQVAGDSTTRNILFSFWCFSCVFGCLVLKKQFRLTLSIYYCWLLVFLASFVYLVVHIVRQRNLFDLLVEALQTWEYYVELIADFCLTNVILGDVIYSLIDTGEDFLPEETVKNVRKRKSLATKKQPICYVSSWVILRAFRYVIVCVYALAIYQMLLWNGNHEDNEEL